MDLTGIGGVCWFCSLLLCRVTSSSSPGNCLASGGSGASNMRSFKSSESALK